MVKKPINRQLAIVSANTDTDPFGDPLIVVFNEPFGNEAQRFDFRTLGLSSDLAVLLATAFRARYANLRPMTRTACMSGLRLFARFMADTDTTPKTDVTTVSTTLLYRYIEWLNDQTKADGSSFTTQSKCNFFSQLNVLLRWLKRRRPDVFGNLDIPYIPFPNVRQSTKRRRQLNTNELQALWKACQCEIASAWADFQQGQQTVAIAPDPLPPFDSTSFVNLLWHVHQLGDGILPTQPMCVQAEIDVSVFKHYRGHQAFGRYLHLTPDTLVPYYLAIALQTGANPEALRQIDQDCFLPDPLAENLMSIVWNKGRSTRQQRSIPFDAHKRWTAPTLIRQVIAMAEPLRQQGSQRPNEPLFLIRSLSGQGSVSVINSGALRSAIRRFIQRHQLPADFTPVMLRGAMSTEIFKTAEGDILAAKQFLNHKHLSTTEQYIHGEETQRLLDRQIKIGQALWLSYITNGHLAAATASATTQKINNLAMSSATHSHHCKAPLDGSGRDANVNKVCPHFAGCFSCPGLTLPVDAETLARLLQVARHLEAAREQLGSRWALLYAPQHRILVDDILPDYPQTLYADAEALLPLLPPLPELE